MNDIEIGEIKKVFFIGIGGSSMSGIAMILNEWHIDVLGSDSNENNNTNFLMERGINVFIGHDKKNITDDIDVVVYTAAINELNEELIEAKRKNIKIYERAKFLGELTKKYNNCIGIAGTHGKTSTTSMLSSIFLEANMDPTIQVGSYLNLINGNFRVGKSENFILETCEYKDSFLNFSLNSAIVLNIDNDHLDYFHTLDNIKNSFYKFVSNLNENGYLIVNNDDNNSKDLGKYTNAKVISVAIDNEANFVAKNIKYNNGYPCFDLYVDGVYERNFELGVFGKFNILNALAAIALASLNNISYDCIYNGIKNYLGVSRRLEFKGKYNGALVYDDYAHHPSEIKAIFKALKDIVSNKIYIIFQPHTYSRVNNYKEEFAEVLSDFDKIIIMDIYAAREKNIYNVHAKDIVDIINKKYDNKAFYYNTFEEIVNYLNGFVNTNDIILMVGAGDINKLTLKLIK